MDKLFPGMKNNEDYWDYDELRWNYMDHLKDKDKVTLAINVKYAESGIGERKNLVSQCMAFKAMVLEFRKIFTMKGVVEITAELVEMAKDLEQVYKKIVGILYDDGMVPVRDKEQENNNNKNQPGGVKFIGMKLPWGPWIITTENEYMVFLQRQKKLRWKSLVSQATQGGDGDEAANNSNNSSNSNNSKKSRPRDKEENVEDDDDAKEEVEQGRGGRYGDPRNNPMRNQERDRSRSRDRGKKRKKKSSNVSFNIDNIDSIPSANALSPSAV